MNNCSLHGDSDDVNDNNGEELYETNLICLKTPTNTVSNQFRCTLDISTSF